jgi:hypothetical protein
MQKEERCERRPSLWEKLKYRWPTAARDLLRRLIREYQIGREFRRARENSKTELDWPDLRKFGIYCVSFKETDIAWEWGTENEEEKMPDTEQGSL